jgi:ribosomal protein S18 acetylase RimI-like enzyme
VRRAGRHRIPAVPPRSPSAAELRPASDSSAAELAELFTAGYHGYELPVELDEAAFSTMAELSDFDLGLSRVALIGARMVGVGVIGVRGDEGWIGGLGIVASERRHGIGRRLMESVLDAARDRSIRRVSLEVLEPNAAAVALYEELGFQRTRMLEVWSLHADPGSSSAGPASTSSAAEWIRTNRRGPEPWQRADESVANLARRGTELEAVALPDRGAALFRVSGDTVMVLQLGALDAGAAEELLRAVRGRAQRLRFVNVPEGDPATEALARLGGELEIRQLEMALTLDNT